MGIVDGKVAIVTGAGRGVGRGEAMELAAQGAKVVCNDLGGSSKGEGSDTSPVDETVKIILERGGEAVANYDDVSSWDGSVGHRRAGPRHLRGARHRGEQRRHPARLLDREDERGRLGQGHRRAPQGHLQHDPPRLRVLVGGVEGRTGPQGLDRQHGVLGGPAGQQGPGQLRGGQGRHRRADRDHRPRGRALRRAGQRRRPRGAPPGSCTRRCPRSRCGRPTRSPTTSSSGSTPATRRPWWCGWPPTSP